MGIAEQLSNAIGTSDLAWSDAKTKPVEFVAAMAGATNLGSDILRAKSQDRAAAHRAVLLLAKKARRAGDRAKLPLSQAMAQAMAAAVLLELVRPHCRLCTGAGVLILDDLKITCPRCGGLAVHRYGDRERANLCGVSPADWHKWSGRYDMVMQVALAHDCAPQRADRRMGGRD
jgi:hypothetical protein